MLSAYGTFGMSCCFFLNSFKYNKGAFYSFYFLLILIVT